MLDNQVLAVNRGALSEQFAGQELLSIQDVYIEPELYYWSRDARGSTAEIDYLLPVGGQIIPVEVKSGSTGRMKSLQLFMTEHKSTLALRFSELPMGVKNSIASLPFYLISEVKRLIQSDLAPWHSKENLE